MGFFKKFLSGFLKFFLILIIIIVIIAAGLTIFYFITHQDVADYLPDDFFVYMKIASIRDIYDNVLNLKAADIVFSSSKDLKAIYKTILDFKSGSISRNFFFRKLLEVRADVFLSSDYTPVLVFDTGILSLATRLFPVFNSLIRIEGFDLNVLQKGKITIFHYPFNDPADPGAGIYFSFHSNLTFLSTKSEYIEKLYAVRKSGKNLKSNTAVMSLKDKIRAGGFSEVYINSRALLDSLTQGDKKISSILSEVNFNNYSAFSFRVSNEELFLNIYTTIDVPNKQLQNFLTYNPSSLQVIKYLPDNTTIYSTLNCKSFKELIEILLFFQQGPDNTMMKTINDSCNLLLGMTSDELLFEWMGSENGAFTLKDSPDPVFFLRINDNSRLTAALEKLTNTLFFDEDTSLVLDSVRVNKIKFPDFIKGMLDLFVKGIEAPYYLVIGDYIFFSMSPENLASLSNKYKSDETLIRTDNYKTVTKETPKNANIFLYYDLSLAFPPFLNRNILMTRLLKLYEKGVFSIYYNEKEVKIAISGTGIGGNKTDTFPGFPVNVPAGIESDVYCVDVAGSKSPELIYIDDKNNLIIKDIIEDKESAVPVEKNSEIHVSETKSIYVFSQAGTLYQFDGNANAVDPFPLITRFKDSFFHAISDRELVFYSESDKSLFFINKNGGETKFNYEFTSPLLSSPAFSGNFAAFYPKSFTGTVYLTDRQGTLQNGWPQDGGGISYCSPLLFKNDKGKIQVLFLTQAGVLSLWDGDGVQTENFPLPLKGIFYSNPELVSVKLSSWYSGGERKAILILSAEGVLTLVSMTGTIINEKPFPDFADKKSRIRTFDFDGDGIEEVFIYGAKNSIMGIGRDFATLPGFPVKGSKKPAFADLNFDRTYEIIAGSYDGNIYAYSLSK